MPRLPNMVGETGTIEIPVSHDEPLVVTYKRGRRSPREQIDILKQQRELAAMQSDGTPDPRMIELMVEMLSETIVAWNLTDADGGLIPTTPEALLDVPMDVLVSISQEIGRQQQIDPLSSGGSSSGLSVVASSEPRPTTTAS